MKPLASCTFLPVIGCLVFFGGAIQAQDLSDVALGPMMQIAGGPDDSFAFTCMVEVKQPSHAQLTVRLWNVANGRAQPVMTNTFLWRGDENAGNAVQGQILLFGQSGAEVGRKGRHYLSLLSGFEGNPVQKNSTAGPLAIDNAPRWWSRYGFDAPAAERGKTASQSLLYVMGSGESSTATSLAELQRQSRQQQQIFAALTVEFGPLAKESRP